MGRPKLELLYKSKALMKIIFFIMKGKNFPAAIAKLEHKDTSGTNRQFKILEKANFIEQEVQEKRKYNIKTYKITVKGQLVFLCYLKYGELQKSIDNQYLALEERYNKIINKRIMR